MDGISAASLARAPHKPLNGHARPGRSAQLQLESVHRGLAHFNRQRLAPGLPDTAAWEAGLDLELALRRVENGFVEQERHRVAPLLQGLPHDADGFMAWFEELKSSGPGQNDALFPWLAQSAPLAAMRWFIQQEQAGEAGFDDLVALTQLRLPPRAKLELARNYWDEMGRGRESGMHGPMLAATAAALDVHANIEATGWEPLALGNLMAALALNRRYAYHSVGALGVIEMTSPTRVGHVNAGLKRLGHGAAARRYFQLHAGLDVRHSIAWNAEAIRPLVEGDTRLARPIAEGALMRLNAGARCYAFYRRHLWGETDAAPRRLQ